MRPISQTASLLYIIKILLLKCTFNSIADKDCTEKRIPRAAVFM